MKTYTFSVIIGNHFERFHVNSKTLASALKSLDSEIIKSCRYCRELQDWIIFSTYILDSSSGRSYRRLRKVIRGVV